MRRERPANRKDRGSVLLWAIGCLVAGLLTVSVMMSVASLVTATRELQMAVDAAALAAANQLDLTTFRATGELADLRVDEASAAAAARAELAASPLRPGLSGFGLTGTGVWVQAAADWQSPIGGTTQRLTAHSLVELVPTWK